MSLHSTTITTIRKTAVRQFGELFINVRRWLFGVTLALWIASGVIPVQPIDYVSTLHLGKASVSLLHLISTGHVFQHYHVSGNIHLCPNLKSRYQGNRMYLRPRSPWQHYESD